MWDLVSRNRVDEETVVKTFECTECGREVELEHGFGPKEPCPCEGTVRPGEAATYTTAPEDYDWFGTRTVDPAAGTSQRGRAVRKVAGPAGRVEAQRARYGSGLHLAVDEAEWCKLVEYGLCKEA